MRAPTSASGAVTNTTCTGSAIPSELLVLREREAIGHTRDVVGDRASFALLGEARQHVTGERGAARPIGAVEVPERFLRAPAHLEHARMRVELRIQELLQASL